MWSNLRRWLQDTNLTDPIERRQAPIVQAIIVGVIAVAICAVPLALAAASLSRSSAPAFLGPLVFATSGLSALLLLRRGNLHASVRVFAAGLFLGMLNFGYRYGAVTNPLTALALAIPVVLVGLLLPRRDLIIAVGAAVLGLTGLLFLEGAAAGSGRLPQGARGLGVLVFAIMLSMIALLFDRFSMTLRAALADALQREQDLIGARAALEQTVAERTAALRDALAAVEEREASLRATLDELQVSRATIQSLSAPVLPVLPGVLLAPLAGALDADRADAFASHTLAALERDGARHLIFDVTGVAVVDTHVAQTLIRAAAAARLLGAQVTLVGVGPEVAQTVVALGVDFSGLRVHADLREALRSLSVG